MNTPITNRPKYRYTMNPNILWAETFVNELALCGLRAVCIAPGSRSTPLTLAFDAHPAIEVYGHLDERSAGFFALGLAMAMERPVALVCTSGTAAANFYPAIIEAHYSQVPLLVLTADRPPELRESGANQTIDQVKMYTNHVLWSVDVALPDVDAPAVVLRYLQTLAARAYATAGGLAKGAVHLNFPFRAPLEPSKGAGEIANSVGARQPRKETSHVETTSLAAASPSPNPPNDEQRPHTRILLGRMTPSATQVKELAEVIGQYERGLIVCGPEDRPSGEFAAAVGELSRQAGYPILADPISGVRFGPHVARTWMSGAYNFYLAQRSPLPATPQVVLRFGAVPTSKPLNSYLDNLAEPSLQIHVRANGRWADDNHRVATFLQADPVVTCFSLCELLHGQAAQRESTWTTQLAALETACWQALEQQQNGTFFDGTAVADILAWLPPATRLFAGNSLPVRHVDQFGRPTTKAIYPYGNRGASGIDGNVSTALGIAAAGHDAPLVAILGDITLYHDLNGLLALKQLGSRNVTIILLNNNGGGIFHRLPIAAFEPPFTRRFLTPHDLDFAPAAEMYGLHYHLVTDRAGLIQALDNGYGHGPRLIELRTNSHEDYQCQRALNAAVIKIINNR
jgi:2-succinyl-5-enolpyruvyl-6-hydroxy-3-cyclohexene-1-carboxylate synthase